MGYTHYYYVSSEFDAKLFEKVAIDFKKMVTPLKHLGIILADGLGENTPTISPTEIRFNGLEKCGHTQRDLGITWPKPQAKGILKNSVSTQLQQMTKSNWFAGCELESRVCGGDCSHETFSLEQKMENIPELGQDEVKTEKLIFECTKTAYKPYDLAVNVCLIIAKHYLKKQIIVKSDGDESNWIEGKQLCQHFLGYGENFVLGEDNS